MIDKDRSGVRDEEQFGADKPRSRDNRLSREEALAAQMRENLKRRKAQSRARQSDGGKN